MDDKFSDTQIETLPIKYNELLLSMNTITQLKDLHSFFKTLTFSSNRYRIDSTRSTTNDHIINKISDKKTLSVMEKIDKVIELDFLDKIPR